MSDVLIVALAQVWILPAMIAAIALLRLSDAALQIARTYRNRRGAHYE